LSEADAGLQISGSLSVADLDSTDTLVASVAGLQVFSGSEPALLAPDLAQAMASMLTVSEQAMVADGAASELTWSFDSGSQAFNFLAEGQSLDLVYTIMVTDSAGGEATRELTITVTGTNDAPVAEVAVNAAAEDGEVVTGNVTSTDADVAGRAGTYTLYEEVAGLTLNAEGS